MGEKADSTRIMKVLPEDDFLREGDLDPSLEGKLNVDKEGVIIRANLKARQTFGGNVVGRDEIDLVWPEDVPLYREKVKLRREGRTQRYVAGMQRTNGIKFPALVLTYPYYKEGSGVYDGGITKLLDLERGTNAIQIIKAPSRAVLHDIRNHLTTAGGFVELIKLHFDMLRGQSGEKVVSDQKLDEILEQLGLSMGAIDRSVYLAENFLSSKGKRERADLSGYIKHVLDEHNKYSWVQPFTIIRDLKGPLLVAINKAELETVLGNLIKNGVEAMEAKGLDSGIIRVGSYSAGKNAEFYVEDQGCGIPPEIQEKIFNEIGNTTKEEDHYGLGLYSAFRSMEEMGGYLKLSWTEIGKGTRFIGGIPLAKVHPGTRKRNT